MTAGDMTREAVSAGVMTRLDPRARDAAWPSRRVFFVALSVSLAYLAGSQLGLLLRLPGATPSVFWPPNALLTGALLLIPPRLWAVCLLAVLPAHLIMQLNTDWPAALVFGLFLTNCSEALIGATALRVLSDRPTSFDSLERVQAFIVAVVLLAPVASSFLDAGVVAAFGAEPYWSVWQTRVFSNVLTELTVVPAVIGLVTHGPAWVAHATRARLFEAGSLMAGLLGTCLLLTVWPFGGQAVMPGSTRVPLAFLLPFIAWAAVRFGPTGASAAILTATVITVSAAAHGRSPVDGVTPGESVLGLQLLLTAVAMPHLVLAAAIEAKHQASRALSERLRFEKLLSQLSQAFLHVPSERMDEAFETWLHRVGDALHVDGLMLFRLSDETHELMPCAAWMRPGAMGTPVRDPAHDFPWATAQILANREVVVEVVDDLPAEAPIDRQSFARYGFVAGLGLPLASGDRVVGSFSYMSMVEPIHWAPAMVAQLRLVAEIFGNAMARQRTEDALRASETLKSAILGSLTSGVAVLDRDGCIIAVNERWKGPGGESGLGWAGQSVGDNLLAACQREAEHDDRARRLLDGSRAVLAGRLPEFVLQHSNGDHDGMRYWVLTVRPLNHPQGGAVVTSAEITERKRAELEVQAARAELAHMSRVSTMGELTASLAHELNQPLAAIVANAQAARHLLARSESTDEIPEVLTDIVDDGMRAGAVIQRTRDMLRKGGPSRARLDLAALVRDVAGLVTNDALIRNVTIRLSLPQTPTHVEGDRIQLQQVMLNLLMNALEAIGDDPSNARVIHVCASAIDGATVHVDVRDTGPGVPSIARAFDAFYTTKASGMGMGLPIARSIVEAHGGTIHVSNNATGGGATAGFSLPLAREAQA